MHSNNMNTIDISYSHKRAHTQLMYAKVEPKERKKETSFEIGIAPMRKGYMLSNLMPFFF